MRDIDAGVVNRDTMISGALALAVMVVGFLASVILGSPTYILNQLYFVALFGFVAIAWNLVSGYAGQVSLGHAVFFAIGAYTSTVLWNDLGISPWIGMFVGAVLAGAVALIVGYASFRRGITGHYFALFTIGLAAAAHAILLELKFINLFGLRLRIDAASGLTVDIPQGTGFITNLWSIQFLDSLNYVLLMGVMLLALSLFAAVLYRSRFGYWMRAVRDDEDAAEALGVDAFRIKMIALFISAFFTAIGGTMFAQQQLYIHPNSVTTVLLSVQIAVIAIIGGIDVPYGPLVGSAVIYTITTILQSSVDALVNVIQLLPLISLNQSWVASGINTFVYGLLLVLVIIYFDQGVAGTITRWYERDVKGRASAGAGTTVAEKSD
jgi:branched-chain amino acid transport system permease protein